MHDVTSWGIKIGGKGGLKTNGARLCGKVNVFVVLFHLHVLNNTDSFCFDSFICY